jgi:hypothetical protein
VVSRRVEGGGHKEVRSRSRGTAWGSQGNMLQYASYIHHVSLMCVLGHTYAYGKFMQESLGANISG